MADPAEIEFARIRSVIRGLGWEVTGTNITPAILEIRAVKANEQPPATAIPR